MRPKDIGTRVCVECGEERPKGRTRYCSDSCYQMAAARKEALRAKSRLRACQHCLGPKEPGRRGSKYCDACRRLLADATEQMEQERARRRYIAARQARIDSGERLASVRSSAPTGTKWCPRCQQFLGVAEFPKRKDTGKQAAYCRPCQRQYNRERRLTILFGLSWDEYEMLLSCQGGRCAICGGRPRRHALSVDHDHKTGEVRGLLCSRCNHKLLGSANDDPARLRRAADYLEEFGPREVFGQPRFVPPYPGSV